MYPTKVKKVWRAYDLSYKMSHACKTEWLGRRGLLIPNSILRDRFKLVYGVRNIGTVWNTKSQRREKLYMQQVIFKR